MRSSDRARRDPFKEHLRHGRYALRVEGNNVTSITLIDLPKAPGKPR